MQTNTSMQSHSTQENDILYPRSFLHHDSISPAFIEELASLESMQDNLNYIGEILKSYIAGDYGFSVISKNAKRLPTHQRYKNTTKDTRIRKSKQR